MKSLAPSCPRVFSVLNSLLIVVFILFLTEKMDLSFLFKFSFIFAFLFIASLKVYCMSGFSGCLLSIISEEEIVLEFRRMNQNAKELWPGFAAAFVIIFLIDFLLYSLFPALRIWRKAYFGLLTAIAVFLLARWAVGKKYLGPMGIPVQRLKFNLDFFLVMILACILEMVLVLSSRNIHAGGYAWQNLLTFAITYIHVFEFIFCSLFIMGNYPQINEKFSSPKEIFLINPMNKGIIQSLAFWLLRDHPPFFVVLKALSPKNYRVRKFNRVMWRQRYYKKDVLVCITCFTSNCYEAYKIAKEFKKRGSKVVMGGPHVTYLPDEALAFCDSVVIGGAEGVWGQVVRDYENGTLKGQYSGAATEEDFAKVHQELLDSPPYIVKDFLETMRGCKFRCHFCTIPALSGGKLHIQPVEAFVELIKKIKPHYRQLVFIDNNIYSDPGYSKELFTALKPLKIQWRSQCTIDIAKNQETLKLARESGCKSFLIGYEISGGSLEKDQGGKFGMAQKYLEYTKTIKKAGITVKGHFIYGFDSDDFKSLFQLWKFCFSIRPFITIVSLLTPLPGSGVWRDMLAQDRIINLNWRNYDVHSLVVRHPHLDHRIMSMVFVPLIYPFFLITTSAFGISLFLIVLLFPLAMSWRG